MSIVVVLCTGNRTVQEYAFATPSFLCNCEARKNFLFPISKWRKEKKVLRSHLHMSRCVYVVFAVQPFPNSGRCVQPGHVSIVGSTGSSMCVTCAEKALRSDSATEACSALCAAHQIVPHVGTDGDLLELCGLLLITGVSNCGELISYQPLSSQLSSLLLALLAEVAHDEQQSSDLLQALLSACKELVSAGGAGPSACLSLLSECVAQSAVFAAFVVRGASSVLPLIFHLMRGDTDDAIAEDALYLLLQLLVHSMEDPDSIDLFLNAFAEADGLPAVAQLLSPARDCSDATTNNGLAFLKVLTSVHAAAPLVHHFAGVICASVLPKLVHNHRNDFVIASADILSSLVSGVSVPSSTVDVALDSLRTANDMTAPAVVKLLLATSAHVEPTKAVLGLALRLQDASESAFEQIVQSPLFVSLISNNRCDGSCVNGVAAAAGRSAHSLTIFLALLAALAVHVEDPSLVAHDQAVLVAHVLLNGNHRAFFLSRSAETFSVVAFLACRTDMIHPLVGECLLAALSHEHNASSFTRLLTALRRLPSSLVRELADISLVVRCLLHSPFASSQPSLLLDTIAPLVDWTHHPTVIAAWVPRDHGNDERALWTGLVRISTIGAVLTPRILCSLAARGFRPPFDSAVLGAIIEAYQQPASGSGGAAMTMSLSSFLEIATAVSIWWPDMLIHIAALALLDVHCMSDVSAFVSTWSEVSSAAVVHTAIALLECNATAGVVVSDLCVSLVSCYPSLPARFVLCVAGSPLAGSIFSHSIRLVRRRLPERNARIWTFLRAVLCCSQLMSNHSAAAQLVDSLMSHVLGQAVETTDVGDVACHLEVVQLALAADVEHRSCAGDVACARWASGYVGSFAAAWKVLYVLLQRPHAPEISQKIRSIALQHDADSEERPAAFGDKMYRCVVLQLVLHRTDTVQCFCSLVTSANEQGCCAAVLFGLMSTHFDAMGLSQGLKHDDSAASWLNDVVCELVVTSPPRTVHAAVSLFACIASVRPEMVHSMEAFGAVTYSLAPSSRLPQHATAHLVAACVDPCGEGSFEAPAWWRHDELVQRFLDTITPSHEGNSGALIRLGKILASASHFSFRCNRIADFAVDVPNESPWALMEEVDGSACFVASCRRLPNSSHS